MKNKNSDNNTYLTSNLGVPIANNQSSLTVGERGPGLLQNVQLIEKLSSFDSKIIQQGVVHVFKPSPDTNIPDLNIFWDFFV